MLDSEGSSAVADASRQFKFAAPAVSFDRLPRGVPLLVVRAGRDEMPGLNDSIDRFRSRTASAGLAVELLEHPSGPHAFDIMDDSDTSREVISAVLAFLCARLARP